MTLILHIPLNSQHPGSQHQHPILQVDVVINNKERIREIVQVGETVWVSLSNSTKIVIFAAQTKELIRVISLKVSYTSHLAQGELFSYSGSVKQVIWIFNLVNIIFSMPSKTFLLRVTCCELDDGTAWTSRTQTSTFLPCSTTVTSSGLGPILEWFWRSCSLFLPAKLAEGGFSLDSLLRNVISFFTANLSI